MIKREENPSYLNEFLDYSENVLGKTKNSIKEMNYDLAFFLKFIMHKYNLSKIRDIKLIKEIKIRKLKIDLIKTISLDDIYDFVDYLEKDIKRSKATIARKLSTIRAFFDYLYNVAKTIDKNPAMNIITPKYKRNIPKSLNIKESKKLLKSVRDNKEIKHGTHDNSLRNYAIILLILSTGVRINEIAELNIKDVDFKESKLQIIKGKEKRDIPLNKDCIKAIENYLSERPKNLKDKDAIKALFLSERRKRIARRTIQYIIKKELDIAELDSAYSAHKLRHTFAKIMYQEGKIDLKYLQEILGHRSIATMDVYTKKQRRKK